MKKLMIYLDEEMHEEIRVLAFRKRTTMAALVRHALEETYEDELDAIAAEQALSEYAADPEAAVTLEDYMQRRGIALPSRSKSPGATRLRRVAEERSNPYHADPGGAKE